MPFLRTRSSLILSAEEITELEAIIKSRTSSHSEVQRARILLDYYRNTPIAVIARNEKVSRPTVERCIDKALSAGYKTALVDIKRSGRPPIITDDAKAWVVKLACNKPIDYDYAAERWTLNQLAKHIQTYCENEGFSCLSRVNKTAIKRILDEQPVQPHKTNYYLVRKDSEFDIKMAQVLVVYHEANLVNDKPDLYDERQKITISYDEKPGIQAIAGIAPDLAPEPGKYATWGRDYEYQRLGTVSLLAGIDLHNGHILHLVRERHRSLEFTEFLQLLHEHYDPTWQIRVILDNHSAHVSKETMQWLKEHPNRFEFVFTPKHGSWLNMIEMFFSKMTRSFLRSLRVSTKDELILRIDKYINEVNADPVVFRWKYRLDELSV
jgi:transposase